MMQNRNSLEEINQNHRKKMVAPIVISAIMIVYYCFFIAVCIMMPMPFVIKAFMGIIPLGVAGVVIYVLMERINEIRSGEEDDLGKY